MAVERHFAEHRLAALHAAVEHVDLAQEFHDELRGRLVEHFFRRADLFDLALVHHDDAVGDFERFFLIVRDENAGDVNFVVQPAEPGPQALADFGIECTERFVQQQHLRLDGQRPRERRPLPLAAGKLRREPLAEAVQVAPSPAIRGRGDRSRPSPAALCAAALACRTPRFRKCSCGGRARSAETRSRRGAGRPGGWRRPLRGSGSASACRPTGVSSPAMIRSSVVLPEPLGPKSATSSPSLIDRLTSRSAWYVPNDLLMCDKFDAHRTYSSARAGSRACSYSRRTRHSTTDLAASVTSANRASSEATANAAAKLYSL